MKKTISDIISSSVRSYSDFGKSLEVVIKNALNVDFDKLSVIGYNHLVTTIVKEELDKHMLELVSVPITEKLNEYLGALEKKEWKLSEIIEKFINEEVERDEPYGEIKLEVCVESYGYAHIYFDKDSDKRKYECEYQLDLDKEGNVYSFQAGEYRPHRGELREKPVHGRFDAFIFKLYAAGCKVIIDERDCVTSWDFD